MITLMWQWMYIHNSHDMLHLIKFFKMLHTPIKIALTHKVDNFVREMDAKFGLGVDYITDPDFKSGLKVKFDSSWFNSLV